MSKFAKTYFSFAIILFIVVFIWGKFSPARPTNTAPTAATQEQDENEVSIKVAPIQLEKGRSAVFQIEFNTHSVNLDFDVERSVFLEDANGQIYSDFSWEGSPPGGHHRRGVLTYLQPIPQTSKITLVFQNISNVPRRVFSWPL